MATEFKVSIGAKRVALTTNDVRALIALDGGNITTCARRMGVARENLSRLINGHKEFPSIRKALERELGRIIEKQRRRLIFAPFRKRPPTGEYIAEARGINCKEEAASEAVDGPAGRKQKGVHSE